MTSTSQERLGYAPTGYQMIRSIEISNFRCYEHLKLQNIARLNVVVGDNGSGKTALLEAIFMALASSTQLALRLRAQRGLDGQFNASPRRIDDAIWGDFFRNVDFSKPITISISGDGPEARTLTIGRGHWPNQSSSVALTYVDASGIERTLFPSFDSQGQPRFPDTGEDMADFFHFPANSTIGSVENAGRFSDISRARAQANFVKAFTDEYKWLRDVNIEVIAGAPALFGTLEGVSNKLPLPNVSGGINRVVAIMLAIASRRRAIVLADEIENGVYYQHQTSMWKGLLRFLRESDGQMICTTHSKEWLEALVEAAGDKLDDIALWRIERGKGQPTVRQFSGATLRAGIEHGTEVRSNE